MTAHKRIAALLGATGVALGAFGAHGLKNLLATHGTADTWHTASWYHLLHAVLLYGVAGRKRSFHLLCAGILIFSGSLYILAASGVKWLGAITPAGGVLLIAGWLSLLQQEPPAP